MSSLHSSPAHRAVLDELRALSAASDLLDAAVAQHLHLHRTDLRCLDHLARFGPISAGRLAEAVGLTTGALTIAVDRLARAGFVQRRDDPTDRRRVVVALTRRADRVVALFADLALATDRLVNAYSDAELQLLGRFLQAASEALGDQAIAIANRPVPARRKAKTHLTPGPAGV